LAGPQRFVQLDHLLPRVRTSVGEIGPGASVILPLQGGAVAANADTMQGMTKLTTARPDPRGQRESLRAARTGAALAERPDLVAVQLDGGDVRRSRGGK